MKDNVNNFAKELLRWIAVVLAGGLGLWPLVDLGRVVLRGNHSWLGFIFVAVVSLLIASPFFAVAYFCLRRQYRKIFLVVGIVGSIFVFGGLMTLPRQLGLFEYLVRHERENPVYGLIGLPLALLALFGPAYAAGWFFQCCHNLAYPGKIPAPKTEATRWLVCLGLICLVIPSLVAMFIGFNHMIRPPAAWVDAGKSLKWVMGTAMIGVLLIFIGFIRRRPVETVVENDGCVQ